MNSYEIGDVELGKEYEYMLKNHLDQFETTIETRLYSML
jgi:hypothetical protein